MREFFKEQLKALHRTTGLQQYFKLKEMSDWEEQFRLLLDDLVQVCTWFPLIPEKDKEKIITEMMLSDGEFIGFNKKIIYKWLVAQNQRYIVAQQHAQNRTEIDESQLATPEEKDYYLKLWLDQVNKIGNPDVAKPARPDGIKSPHIQAMKDKFNTIQCVHPNWMYFSDTEEICNDCGARRNVVPPSEKKPI